MIELIQSHIPFVAFVGAGASAPPPSNLPTWNQFNDLLLESLAERLARYSRNRQPTDDMVAAFRARRDETSYFAPDFQAQLLEEEIGADYFRVWQSLDGGAPGPVHFGLAELASQGRLAAIVTTNFDRLIEAALDAQGVIYEVFFDTTTFERLPGTALPLIKVHGSIEHAESLIDTLRQRVAGRPEPLMRALRSLLHEFPWLYLGFSGNDFSYEPHYLGIVEAAAESPGFVFIAREGKPLSPGATLLRNAYPAEKATVIHADLSTWLEATFHLKPPTVSPPAEGLTTVRGRIQQWTEALGPMAVVNLIHALLEGAGLQRQAHWLLRKTWKRYRSSEDTQSPSYARYNFNYGMSLFEAGFIRNPIALADDHSNLIEWKRHADQNAFEFLIRGYDSGKLPAAGVRLAALMAYRGEVERAIALASEATEQAVASGSTLELCDAAMASVPIYDLIGLTDPAAGQLLRCVEQAQRAGDEPRRAELCAHAGRFLTYGGYFAQAGDLLTEAERIAERLNLQDVWLVTRAARGRWLLETGAPAEQAVSLLSEVARVLHDRDQVPLYTRVDLGEEEPSPSEVKGRSPLLCRVLLDLARAALFAGNITAMESALDELDELTVNTYFGYCPHYYLLYAECLLMRGTADQHELIEALLRRARAVGESTGNPWVAGEADRLEKVLKE